MRNSSWIAHSGVKGMHWGVRRYQNEDGTYTEEGKARRNSSSEGKLTDREKKIIKVGASVGAAALLVYGGSKLYEHSEYGKMSRSISESAKDKARLFREALAKNDGDALKKLKDQIDLEKSTVSGIMDAKKSTASGFISSSVVDAGKKAFATAMAGAGIYGASAFVEGKFDRSKLASSIFNGGPKKK